MRVRFITLVSVIGILTAGCGGHTNPLPEKLEIPKDMHPVLKEFFTICPTAMSDPLGATLEAKATGWEVDFDFDDTIANSTFQESFRLNKSISENDVMLTVGRFYFPSFVSIHCGLSTSFSASDDYNLDIDWSELEGKFGFTGNVIKINDSTNISLEKGNYPSSVILNGQQNDSFVYINMNRTVPKSDPLYSR